MAYVKNAFEIFPHCGITLAEFWTLTPFSFNLILQKKVEIDRDEFKERRFHTWDLARLMRIETFPSFELHIKEEDPIDGNGCRIDEEAVKAAFRRYDEGLKSANNCKIEC